MADTLAAYALAIHDVILNQSYSLMESWLLIPIGDNPLPDEMMTPFTHHMLKNAFIHIVYIGIASVLN